MKIFLNRFVLSGAIMLGLGQAVVADNAVLPNTFTAGTPAVADEVNANFQMLRDAVNNKPDASLGYSATPTVRGVTITNVKLNGGAIIAPVAPGSTINVTFDYHIVDTGCPGCVDQIQVGFSHLAPQGCVFNGIPGAAGVSGSATIAITAPADPGVYYLGNDRSQAFNCPAGWWNGAPKASNRWIAAITVR